MMVVNNKSNNKNIGNNFQIWKEKMGSFRTYLIAMRGS